MRTWRCLAATTKMGLSDRGLHPWHNDPPPHSPANQPPYPHPPEEFLHCAMCKHPVDSNPWFASKMGGRAGPRRLHKARGLSAVAPVSTSESPKTLAPPPYSRTPADPHSSAEPPTAATQSCESLGCLAEPFVYTSLGRGPASTSCRRKVPRRLETVGRTAGRP